MDIRRRRLLSKIQNLLERRDDWLSATQIAVLTKSSKPMVAEVVTTMPGVLTREATTKNGHTVNVYTIKRSTDHVREPENATQLETTTRE